MLKKIGVTLVLGIVWLFIFSIPVADNKKLFDLAHTHIVSNKPFNWIATTVKEKTAQILNSDTVQSITKTANKNSSTSNNH